MEPIRLVIADDHAVVRSGLRLLLDAEEASRVVAEAGEVDTATRMVAAHRPTCSCSTSTCPGRPSLPAIPSSAPADTRVVVLTMQNDPAFAREALQAGALRLRAQGGGRRRARRAPCAPPPRARTYLNPELGARMAAEPPEPAGPPDDLTEREVEILRLIALGHTNAEIGEQLYLSVRTVESHRAHIQQKTRRTTRAELVRYALDHGLRRPIARTRSGNAGATPAVPRLERLDLQLAAHQRGALAHARERRSPRSAPPASKPPPSSATRTSSAASDAARPRRRRARAARAWPTLVSASCTSR